MTVPVSVKQRRNRLKGPWSFRQGLAVLFCFVALYALTSWVHVEWIRTTIGFDAYLGDGPRMPPALLITNQIIKAVVLVGVVWLVGLKLARLNWHHLGFRRCKPIWLIAAVMIALIGAFASLILAKLMISLIPDWSGFTASRYALDDGPAVQIALLVILTVIITPIAEEIFFRGFLFQWMATYRPVWLAVAASSIMFGVSHIIPPQVIVATFMSFLILFLFLKSGSLWPCIVCHVTNNLLGVALGMAAMAGALPVWLTPPA